MVLAVHSDVLYTAISGGSDHTTYHVRVCGMTLVVRCSHTCNVTIYCTLVYNNIMSVVYIRTYMYVVM